MHQDEDYPVFIFKNTAIDEIIYRLRAGKLKGVYLFCTHLQDEWRFFLSKFKVITAAGGLVKNQMNQLLFIYRGQKWDLPKGRIEKGEILKETAIREVEEECGVTNVSINRFLLKTYHVFYVAKEVMLKETFWYEMETTYSGTLQPQLEEGITIATFIEESDLDKMFENTYANIKLVYAAFKL